MKVTFSETSEMYIVDCFLGEVSPDKIWFTRDELDSFRSNVVNHIKRLRSQEQGRILLPADSVIGLERFITREVTEESQRRKNILMREVLHSTVHDQADRLAKISAEYSTWAQARAQQSAIFLEAVLVCEDLDQHLSNYLPENSFVSGI